MPKVPRVNSFSALRKARNLFIQNQGSETEEEAESDASEENSHIPLRIAIPLLDTVRIVDDEPEMDMQQINNQLANILQQLQGLNDNQNRQQQAIENLQNAQPAAAPAPAPVPVVAPVPQQGVNLEHLSKIPDPIKAIPTFDGNRKQLSAWLTTAENTLNLFRPHVDDTLYGVYVTAVLNKIQGKAKDVICLAGNPQEFETIKEILTNALGDRQELSTYKCQLWQTQMGDMSIHKYYQRSKELVQNIKTLAKQKETYKNNWQAINEFIEEDGLAAFIAGLREPYFGYAQAARPADLEDAYAFLCKFKSKEVAAACIADKSVTNRTNFQNKKDFKPFNKQPSAQYENRKQDFKDNQKNLPVPMEIDPSMRSRLTLNKKLINNQELSESDEEESDAETNVNFQENQEPEDQT